MHRFTTTLVIIAAAEILFTVVPAFAQCRSERDRPVPNLEAQVANRQLAALYGIQRARKCSVGDAQNGLFNACRDIALRIAQTQQTLNTLRPSLPCSSTRKPTVPKEKGKKASALVEKGRISSSRTTSNQTAMRASQPINKTSRRPPLYCVRLTDGYYVPAPHSQFDQQGGNDAAIAQCRFICETDNVELYTLRDRNHETTTMVSVTSGRAYTELPTAFNYQSDVNFKRCNWSRYVDLVAGRRALRKTVAGQRGMTIPTPRARPQTPREETITPPIHGESYFPMIEQDIRVVGAPLIEHRASALKHGQLGPTSSEP